MNVDELIQKSPLRALDKALDGGLDRGELAFVIARHGAGKTPFVVDVSVDALLRGKRVLHVSLDAKVDHVREFYEQIFNQICPDAESRLALHLDMERGRRIHAYLANSFTLDKLQDAISFMRDHAEFTPDLLIVDGLDLASAPDEIVSGLQEMATQCGAALWMTAVRHREEAVDDPDGIPEPVARFKDAAKLILDLRSGDGGVEVRALLPELGGPDGRLGFVLDPTSMVLHSRK